MEIFEKETVFDILQNVGFYDNIPKVRLEAARIKDILYDLPKKAKIRKPPLPTIENVQTSSDLESEGVKTLLHHVT